MLKLNRNQIAKFVGDDPQAIRAIEELFQIVGEDSTVDLDSVILAVGIAANLARSYQPNHIAADYIDLRNFAPGENKHARLRWNDIEDTLNIGHDNGVVQQVGFEQYMLGKNSTGATLTNGTVVGFSGVDGDITVTKYIADGTYPELYFVGVLTSDIAPGAISPVTLYGKVREMNTTGSPYGETWVVGDILYASPTVPGGLTNIRPTAPNVVIAVGAVLAVGSTNGEILVRPVVPIGLDYGSFDSAIDQTIPSANTAQAVTLENTETSNGISVVSGSRITVSQAGLYDLSISLQVTSSNASSIDFYAWLRKMGVDIPRSRLDFTIKANGDTKIVSTTYQISMQAGEYIQIMVAANATGVFLDARPILGFAPDAPSAIVTMSQRQL